MKLTEAMRKKAEQYDSIDGMPQLKKLMKDLKFVEHVHILNMIRKK